MSREPTRRPSGVVTDRCFADEVAIDFPSVDAAVDRMRDAFLAPDERPRALHATISLSAREAFDGAVLPLDLLVPGTCRSCGGRGETWTHPCADCQGSGEALFSHPVRVSVPPGVGDGARIRLRVSTPHAPLVTIDVHVTITQGREV